MFDYHPSDYFDKTDPFSGMYDPSGLSDLKTKEIKKKRSKSGMGNYDILEKSMKTNFPDSGIKVHGLYRKETYRKETVQNPMGEYRALEQSYMSRLKDDAYTANMRKAEFTRKYNLQSH